MALEQVFHQFQSEVPFLIASAIVDVSSGIAVISNSSDPGFDPTVASASYTKVVHENARALELLGEAPSDTEDILITTSAAYMMIRMIGTRHIHGLAMAREGNLGLTRVIMKKYEPAFLDALRAAGLR